MVLCVCGVTPGENTVTDQGEVLEGLPTLDVTDGWYKLRATVDDALARAVKRGLIKVGTKLAISGAKFQGGKDGIEPLQAYETTCLELHGNSTTLARWDAKLGFQAGPFISTLRSLTADGGTVPLMDICVTKLFPIAYIEMPKPRDDAEGEEPRPLPRCEAEEMEARDEWQRKRANEEMKLREDWEKKVARLEGLAENLERTAGRWVPPEDDYPPDEVEDLLDELEDADDLNSLVKGLSPTNAGWLAQLVRKKCRDKRDKIGETIQRELEKSCPPREVRNFRVIRFKDHRKTRRPARRTGQMTVWDALSLGEGGLVEGKRFLVTNVVPCQPGAWSHHEEEGRLDSSSKAARVLGEPRRRGEKPFMEPELFERRPFVDRIVFRLEIRNTDYPVVGRHLSASGLHGGVPTTHPPPSSVSIFVFYHQQLLVIAYASVFSLVQAPLSFLKYLAISTMAAASSSSRTPASPLRGPTPSPTLNSSDSPGPSLDRICLDSLLVSTTFKPGRKWNSGDEFMTSLATAVTEPLDTFIRVYELPSQHHLQRYLLHCADHTDAKAKPKIGTWYDTASALITKVEDAHWSQAFVQYAAKGKDLEEALEILRSAAVPFDGATITLTDVRRRRAKLKRLANKNKATKPPLQPDQASAPPTSTKPKRGDEALKEEAKRLAKQAQIAGEKRVISEDDKRRFIRYLADLPPSFDWSRALNGFVENGNDGIRWTYPT
ncbi:hypothetical protein FRC01_008184 [Tulasnella sp. 417]|nr:hypothetical protein FRC01_008184 [Tulasnella sp. 417]